MIDMSSPEGLLIKRDGGYLRVKTPVTIDGTTPKVGEDDRAEYKITILPLSARKRIEEQNETLPSHLHHKFEVVKANSLPSIPEEKVVTTEELQKLTGTEFTKIPDDEELKKDNEQKKEDAKEEKLKKNQK